MSLNDYLKCPGPERSVAAMPETYPCPECGDTVEIWSDERRRRCTGCNTMVHRNGSAHERLGAIRVAAIAMGASDAAILPSHDILVEEDLAALCNGDPPCENYGLSPSCPPHVSGPSGFRELQKQSRYTLLVRLDVPSAILFNEERREVMQLLHDILAAAEQTAVQHGFSDASGFAGGSCKKIYCHDHEQCGKLSEEKRCRHPGKARPSMSGFGINVAEMFRSVGWELSVATSDDAARPDSMAWVAGIVVIC